MFTLSAKPEKDENLKFGHLKNWKLVKRGRFLKSFHDADRCLSKKVTNSASFLEVVEHIVVIEKEV